MIRKDMAKSALISLLLALLSCAFLISVLRPSYAYGEKYMTYLKGGSETVSQDAQKLADEQNALNNEINDYQNNHNTGGVKQAELPVELEEKIIDFSQKNSQAGAGLDSMFSLIEGELYSQQNALKLISERVRGYSRNARRGVTDEYSLKLSDKLISDYNAVITDLKKSDDIIDTRAADTKLHYFAEWWKQLYGESEGKDQKGIFPAACDFTTDLHSMGQWIQEGERSIFETVISVETPNEKLLFPHDDENLDGLNFLEGKRVDEVNKMAELGTRLAHVDGGVPNILVNVPELNAYYLGQLIYFFEKACGISGLLEEVNPFNQPGVEAYKKNMFALLNKPGYEAESKAIQERLANEK